MSTEMTTPEEAPKFEIRGFEMNIEGKGPAEGEIELTAEQADAMGAGPLPVTALTEAPPEAAAEVTPKVEPKIKIGAREFDNTDAAWAYAQELEQEKLVSDAFRHGIETAAKAAPGNIPAAPEPAKPKLDFTTDFYSDPEGYFARREAEVLAKAEAKIAERDNQAAMAKRNEETWSGFYKDYPDLSKAQPLVKVVLEQEWSNLEKVETKKALKIIAEKARAMKQAILEDAMPGTQLPKVTHTASPTGGPEVTRTPTEGRTLSFVEQMKQNNRKKSARGIRR